MCKMGDQIRRTYNVVGLMHKIDIGAMFIKVIFYLARTSLLKQRKDGQNLLMGFLAIIFKRVLKL